MSKLPKFKITFAPTEAAKKTTCIVLNGEVVGSIHHPGYSTHAPEKFHIVLFQRVIASPKLKALKPLFGTISEAKQYVSYNLQSIHNETPLYLEHPPKDKKVKHLRFIEDLMI